MSESGASSNAPTEQGAFFDYHEEQASRGQSDTTYAEDRSRGYTWANSSTHVSHNQDVPLYVPPHLRPVNADMGDRFATAMHAGHPDKMGNDNAKYRKLLHYLPYSLPEDVIAQLVKRFPSFFFSSKDHVNHDHPVSHACASVSWRLATRRIPRGSRILDVYGDPSAARAFNASQANSREPKVMRSLVDFMCIPDFARAINKWGPRPVDDDGEGLPDGEGEYDIGSIEDKSDEYLQQFDVFIFNHSAYYIKDTTLWRIFSARPTALVLINMLKHTGEKGLLNNGELSYEVRGGIVKQVSTVSGARYFHPNITPFWFREDRKHFIGSEKTGFAWEVQRDCEDNWRIEVHSFDRDRISPLAVDYEAMFNAADTPEAHLGEPTTSARARPSTVLAAPDGRFLELSICSWELVSDLRLMCSGKSRKGKKGQELFGRMFDSARLLIRPSSMLPGAKGHPVPPHLVIDHVVCAYVADLQHETDIYSAMKALMPVMKQHAAVADPGLSLASLKEMDASELLTLARSAALVGLKAASVAARPGLKNAMSALNSFS